MQSAPSTSSAGYHLFCVFGCSRVRVLGRRLTVMPNVFRDLPLASPGKRRDSTLITTLQLPIFCKSYPLVIL